MPDGSNINPADFAPPPSVTPNPDYVSAYIEKPARWLYDLDQGNGVSRATYIGEVYVGGQAAGNRIATQADIAASTTGVSTFNTRSGAVVLTSADLTGAGGALLAGPALTGVPTAPTAAPGTATGQLATCSFVTAAIGQVTAASVASFNGRVGAVSLTASDVSSVGGAMTNSPALTGTPTTPTAAVGNASGQIASTQFVSNAIAGAVVSWNGRTGPVTMTLSDVTSVGGAPLLSPNFTGTPSGPTAAPGTSTTQLASTAFVMAAITTATTGVATWNGRAGTVTMTLADITGAGGAPANNAALTGNPTAPTQTAGTSNTTLATTAFVANAIVGLPGVASFNGRQGAVTFQLADGTSVGLAPLASPSLSGTPLSTTPTAGDNSTRIATTAFVATNFPTNAQVAALYAPIASPTFTGTVTIPAGASISGYAPLASPAFSGAPTAPNGNAGVTAAGSTQLATQSYVRSGVTDGGAALAGQVGEYLQAINSGGVSYGTSAWMTIAQLTLPAGDWDVGGWAQTNIGGGNGTYCAMGIGTSPNAAGTQGGTSPTFALTSGTMSAWAGSVPSFRYLTSVSSTLYLCCYANFTSGTTTSYAGIFARRAR